MEVEKIIISKQYFELTPGELEQVSALVSDEVEYNDMKAFLLSTASIFETQKITSTPELDDKILTHLNANVTTSEAWYNSFLLFLFPRDRRVYQYPVFQIALASVFVFGAFNLINFDSLNQETMAYEEVSEIDGKVTDLKEKEVVEELKYEEADIDSDVSIELNDEIVTVEEKLFENTPADYSTKPVSQYDYNMGVIEAEEEVFSEDSEMLDDMNESTVELNQVFTADTKDNSDLDVIENTNSASNYKDIEEEEGEKVNEAPVTSTGSTTIANTESRNDRGFKFDKSNKVSAKKEMPASASDEYADGSIVQTTAEVPALEEQTIARKASVSLTPELKHLFFEVK